MYETTKQKKLSRSFGLIETQPLPFSNTRKASKLVLLMRVPQGHEAKAALQTLPVKPGAAGSPCAVRQRLRAGKEALKKTPVISH